MNRRSFFNKLLQAAAIIGLAPRLAFRAPEIKLQDEFLWTQNVCLSRYYSEEYLAATKQLTCTLRYARIKSLTPEDVAKLAFPPDVT